MILKLHHVSLPVNDLSAATQFYSDVLGFRQVERPNALPNNGAWLEGYGFQVHLIWDTLLVGKALCNSALPDARHFALQVADIHDFRKHLIKQNLVVGEIMNMSMDKHQFFLCDPSGNIIEITDC